MLYCFYICRLDMAGVSSVACRVANMANIAKPITNSGKLLAVAGINKVNYETNI